MFQLNAFNRLKTWAMQDGRKPLVLRGARQVGKTTMVIRIFFLLFDEIKHKSIYL